MALRIEATVVKCNFNNMPAWDIQIYYDVVAHLFAVGGKVKYFGHETKGELIALGTAEFRELKIKDDHLASIILQITALNFEIKPSLNYTYQALKSIRYKN